jgi:xylulose-5-phosphate/fructose-6-phosphate phosphoketolase
VFDHPNLIALTVVGDGESETGPLATSWHSNKFLNPIRDGAVLPVLHLNGYKINNPTLLARISYEVLEALFVGYGYTPLFLEGNEPRSVHQAMAATLEHAVLEIRRIQQEARSSGKARRPRWPMVILRSPKGWTAPREVDGHYLEGFWRAHQNPITDVHTNPAHLQLLEKMAAQLRAGEALRPAGPAHSGIARPAAEADPAHERQPRGQWRSAAPIAGPAGFPQHRRRGQGAGKDRGRRRALPGDSDAGNHAAEPA